MRPTHAQGIEPCATSPISLNPQPGYDWVFIVNPVWQGLLEVVSSESYFSPACLPQGVIEQGQIERRPARIAQVLQE